MIEFIEIIVDIIKNAFEYCVGFLTYLIEMGNSFLSEGNVLIYVLVLLIVIKIISFIKSLI